MRSQQVSPSMVLVLSRWHFNFLYLLLLLWVLPNTPNLSCIFSFHPNFTTSINLHLQAIPSSASLYHVMATYCDFFFFFWGCGNCFTFSSVCKTEVFPNRNEFISAPVSSCAAILVSQDPNSPLSGEPSIRGAHLTCTARPISICNSKVVLTFCTSHFHFELTLTANSSP